MMDADAGRWLTTQEAMRLTGLKSRNSVYRLADRVRTREVRRDGNGVVREYHEDDLLEYVSGASERLAETSDTRAGAQCIYVVLPDPEARPRRVKVGATSDLGGRLATFRTVAPESSVLVTFDVPLSCEGYALSLARSLCIDSFVEVFDFDSEGLSLFIDTLTRAFMPLGPDS